MEEKNIIIEPFNPTGWEILLKTIIWLIIWLIISFLIFIILISIWEIFRQAFSNFWTHSINTTSPLIPLILIVIWFVTCFLWSVFISWIYNLMNSDKYYDLTKMFKISLSLNVIIFFIFVWLYILFYNNMDLLYMILAFHVIFSIFINASMIESMTNPNYTWVYMIWATMWICLSILIFAIVFKLSDSQFKEAKVYLITLPPLLWYTLIPLCISLWEKMYFKFYEMGNNFLYLPTLWEIMIGEEEQDDVNVE